MSRPSPFAAIAEALKRAQPGRLRLERMRARPLDEPVEDTSADAIAQMIIKSAKLRDRGGPALPEIEKGSAADLILTAGRRRRGEIA